jgi:hypothetical protein
MIARMVCVGEEGWRGGLERRAGGNEERRGENGHSLQCT